MMTNEGTATSIANDDDVSTALVNRDPRPIREKLQNPAAFDAAVSLYHESAEARAALKESFGRTIVASKAMGFEPFTHSLALFLWADDPSTWYVCPECKGKNLDKPNCANCRGVGYRVRVSIPRGKWQV